MTGEQPSAYSELRALAVLLALHMGLRNAEICGLNVRDLDLGGKLLRVQDSKTQAGRRALEVPHFLRRSLGRKSILNFQPV